MLLKKVTRLSVVGVAAAVLLGQLIGVKITPAFAGLPIFRELPPQCFATDESGEILFPLEPTTDECVADCCEKLERCLARAGGDFLKTAHCFDRFSNCEAKCPGFGDGNGFPVE